MQQRFRSREQFLEIQMIFFQKFPAACVQDRSTDPRPDDGWLQSEMVEQGHSLGEAIELVRPDHSSHRRKQTMLKNWGQAGLIAALRGCPLAALYHVASLRQLFVPRVQY